MPRAGARVASATRAAARAPLGARHLGAGSGPNTAIATSPGAASRTSARGSSPGPSASAGTARLPTITGCRNSSARWRASARARPAPSTNSRPPAAIRAASSLHATTRSSIDSASRAVCSRRRASAWAIASRAAPV
jgi:hypothetical protein